MVDRLTAGAGVAVVAPPFSELPANALVAVAADVGASDTWVEHQDLATLHAFLALQDTLPAGQTFAAVLPGEVGPESTLAAIVVAAHLDIPVIDADSAGRALPTLPLSLYDIGGVSASPCAIAGTGAEHCVLTADDADGVEAMMRPLLALPAFGNSAGMALWKMPVSTVTEVGVLRTLDLAERIGIALLGARTAPTPRDPAAAVLELDQLSGAVLARGRFIAQTAADANGMTSDVIRVQQPGGPDIVVAGENENLIVWEVGRSEPIATAPDLACWIDSTGTATTTSDLVAHPALQHDVTLLGLRSDERLWQTAALERFETVLQQLGYWGPAIRTPVAAS